MIKNRTKDSVIEGDVISELTVTGVTNPTITNTPCTQILGPLIVSTENATITHQSNNLFLYAQGRTSINSSHRVRLHRDGDFGSFLTEVTISSTSPWSLSFIIINEIIGAHTYEWRLTADNPLDALCSNQNTSYNVLSESDIDSLSASSKKTNQVIM